MKTAIEDMNIHELRTKKGELVAELRAVVARIQELEWLEMTPELTDAELVPGPAAASQHNAHPEGEEAV